MINIAKDAYMWRVTYQNGTQIPEYDESRPEGRGFAEIDGSQIRILGLDPGHHVIIPECAMPVFFRRRRMELNPNNDEEENLSTTHCIGWKSEKSACYLFVFGDGSTLLTDDLQAV